LRRSIAQLEHHAGRQHGPDGRGEGQVLPFGLATLDARLPAGGLPLGALHEVAGAGVDIEHGTAATLFIAGVLARLNGPVLWAVERAGPSSPDPFPPGLAAAGLLANRIIYAEADKPAGVLAVMEEGLRQRGVAGVVGEVGGRLTLTASRRLQLAAEGTGNVAFVLRLARRRDGAALATSLQAPIAALTRWRIGVLPSAPVVPAEPDVPGLGRACWRLDLVRCRGGAPLSVIVEACDATGRLGLVADMADGQAASAPRSAVG
jgi:protein ImuA